MMKNRLVVLLATLILAGCGSAPPAPAPAPAPKGGGYYQDDGPGDSIPANIDAIPDAVPRAEPPHRYANRPYSVLGRDYVPLKPGAPYRAAGIGSWYGKKFHGQKTSTGETYDMYAMTAAHPTLSLPSYARVTNLANGKSVVVRVNDRGPFRHGRIIDLSYAAAARLGYVGKGSAKVLVESLVPGREPLPAEDEARWRPATADFSARPLPEVADARGIYLQLGAFGNADNAENLRLKLARELGSLGERLVVRVAGGMYRVQIGPWANHDEAKRIADELAELLDFQPVVVHR